MGSYPPPGQGPGPGSVGRRIDEAIEVIEMEMRHAAAYINDAIVPQVRAESISALRNVANTLHNFANKLDQNKYPPPPGTPPRDDRR
jgi:hypothetical protein